MPKYFFRWFWATVEGLFYCIFIIVFLVTLNVTLRIYADTNPERTKELNYNRTVDPNSRAVAGSVRCVKFTV